MKANKLTKTNIIITLKINGGGCNNYFIYDNNKLNNKKYDKHEIKQYFFNKNTKKESFITIVTNNLNSTISI